MSSSAVPKSASAFWMLDYRTLIGLRSLYALLSMIANPGNSLKLGLKSLSALTSYLTVVTPLSGIAPGSYIQREGTLSQMCF